MTEQHITSIRADQQWAPDEWIPIEEIARICRLDVTWITTRIREDVLHATIRDGRYYLSSATVWRARHIACIERQFDADPQLAALVADMSEEINSLRKQLKKSGG